MVSACSRSTMRARRLRREREPAPEQIFGVGIAGLGDRLHLRQRGRALRRADRQRDDLAVPDVGQRRRDRQIVEVDASGHHLGEGLDRSAERDVLDVDAGGKAQPLRGPVRGRAETGGCEVQHAGLRLGRRDQIADRLPALRRRGHQHARLHAEQRHRREIAERIVGQRLVQHDVGALRRRQQQDRVAVRLGLRDGGGADGAAAARPVFQHESLADLLRHLVEHDAGDGVAGVACAETALMVLIGRVGQLSASAGLKVTGLRVKRTALAKAPRKARTEAIFSSLGSCRSSDRLPGHDIPPVAGRIRESPCSPAMPSA